MLTGLVKYRYQIARCWDYRNHCWRKNPIWYPDDGWYQTDIDDFKKFFAQVEQSGSVCKIYLASNDFKVGYVAERPPVDPNDKYATRGGGYPDGDSSKPLRWRKLNDLK